MTRRISIDVEGYNHGGQPIPAACRVGRVIMTSGVFGLDTATGKLPDDIVEQARLMFDNLQRILEAGGSGLDDVIKLTVQVKASGAREALNDEWIRRFPDPATRPARHTQQNDLLPANMGIQCDATAILQVEAR